MKKAIFFMCSVFLLLCITAWAQSDLPITTNLLVHLNGENVVTDSNSLVSEWTDLTGNGHNAIQPDGAKRPAVVADGANSGTTAYDCLDFSDLKAMVIPPDSAFEQDGFTWFIVYQDTDTSNYAGLLWSGYTMPGFTIQDRVWGTYHENDTIACHARNSAGSWTGEAGDTNDGIIGWNLAIGKWETPQAGVADSGEVNTYINPLTTSKPSLADAWVDADDPESNFGVGDYTGPVGLTNHWGTAIGANLSEAPNPDYNFSRHFEGQIAEIAIYSGGLSNAQIVAIADHLKQKYNYGEDDGGIVPLVPLTNCLGIQATGTSGLLPQGDMDEDCDVDMNDFTTFAGKWLSEITL